MARALLHCKTAAVTVATTKQRDSVDVSRIQLPDKTRNSRVLVLGGTGRVGGSTATALSKLCPDLRIIVGGRNRSASKTHFSHCLDAEKIIGKSRNFSLLEFRFLLKEKGVFFYMISRNNFDWYSLIFA